MWALSGRPRFALLNKAIADEKTSNRPIEHSRHGEIAAKSNPKLFAHAKTQRAGREDMPVDQIRNSAGNFPNFRQIVRIIVGQLKRQAITVDDGTGIIYGVCAFHRDKAIGFERMQRRVLAPQDFF